MRLFIAQTLDGFIAGQNDDLGHLTPFQAFDFGYEAHLASCDAVLIGRRTFDRIVPEHGWTYPPGLPGYVLTRRALPSGLPESVRATDDPAAVAGRHRAVFLDGGARAIAVCLGLGLVREAAIFTLPVRLGRGVPLFGPDVPRDERWTVVDTALLDGGVVRTRYTIDASRRRG